MKRAEAIARAIYKHEWENNPMRVETMSPSFDLLEPYFSSVGAVCDPKGVLLTLGEIVCQCIKSFEGADEADMVETIAGAMSDYYHPVDQRYLNVPGEKILELEPTATDDPAQSAEQYTTARPSTWDISVQGIGGCMPWEYTPDDHKFRWRAMATIGIDAYRRHGLGAAYLKNKEEIKVEKL